VVTTLVVDEAMWSWVVHPSQTSLGGVEVLIPSSIGATSPRILHGSRRGVMAVGAACWSTDVEQVGGHSCSAAQLTLVDAGVAMVSMVCSLANGISPSLWLTSGQKGIRKRSRSGVGTPWPHLFCICTPAPKRQIPDCRVEMISGDVGKG
jgi:hypothetical protein